MANYRKSFNFRTGLQVDNDNFVVNANGLVGIGTSIPENYLLNVYGDTRVTGVVTTGSLNAGVGTVTTLTATNSSLGVATVTSIQIAGGPVITNLVGYAYSTFIDDGVGGISTTSRIGIGTTADSTARLKVLGDTNLSGDLNVSNSTISMSGGTVTATTFVGNVTGTATTANNLSDGANITTGTISDARLPDLITSNINISSGISTVDALVVGSAVTINSTGINAVSGIFTATTFIGNVTGTATTATNLADGANITTGTISNDRLPSNINKPSGIITASSFVGDVTGTATTANNLSDGANITTGTISNDRLPSNINKPSGIITASSFVGDVTGTATTANNLSDGANITTGTISDARLPDLITSNINASSGISTFVDIKVGSAVTVDSSGINTPSGIITASSFVGDVTGTATTANNLSDGANITTGTISDDRLPDLITSNINISSGISTFNDVRVGSAVTIGSTGIVTATTFVGGLTGTATTATALSGTPDITVGQVTASNLSASGIVTATTELNVGSDGAGLTALSTGRLGIGTAVPTSELLIRKSSGSLLEVISDSGQSRISIGNSVGVGNSSGVLRFANSAGVLDLVNNDVGDIKSIIHGGTGAGSTGNFKWIYGQTNAERMTLTYDGNLGINDTTPSQRLSVGGGVTVTGSVHIDNDLTIDGTLNANISYPSLISGTNLNNNAGVTTLAQLVVTDSINFDSIPFIGIQTSVGIGTTVVDTFDSIPVGLTVNNTISANQIVVDDLISMPTGFVTATTVSANFNSTNSNNASVSINVLTSPNRIVFTLVGTALTATLNLA